MEKVGRAVVESPSLKGFHCGCGVWGLGLDPKGLFTAEKFCDSYKKVNLDLCQSSGSSAGILILPSPAGTGKLQSKQPLFAEKSLLFPLENPSRKDEKKVWSSTGMARLGLDAHKTRCIQKPNGRNLGWGEKRQRGKLKGLLKFNNWELQQANPTPSSWHRPGCSHDANLIQLKSLLQLHFLKKNLIISLTPLMKAHNEIRKAQNPAGIFTPFPGRLRSCSIKSPSTFIVQLGLTGREMAATSEQKQPRKSGKSTGKRAWNTPDGMNSPLEGQLCLPVGLSC